MPRMSRSNNVRDQHRRAGCANTPVNQRAGRLNALAPESAPMRIHYGRRSLDLEIADDQRVTHHRGPEPLADVKAATAAALESPFQFPPLRLAVTPDDHVALVIGEGLDDPTPILSAIREHLLTAGVDPSAIVSLRADQHDPTDRTQLAYLATTKGGRRIYLNRSIVDAEAVIVVSARRFDAPGAEAALFPAFSDSETLSQTIDPDESREVAWLLGLPFHVQLIDANAGGVAEVIAGAADAAREAEKHRDKAWRVTVPRRPDTVIATTSGSSIVTALDNASRVVQPNGRIVLMVDGMPLFSEAFDELRRASDADDVRTNHPDVKAWARAASHARVAILSDLGHAEAEELFASALSGPEQVQRFLARSADCLILEDSHRSLAVVE